MGARPNLLEQYKSAHCWAACMASWTQSDDAYYYPWMSQDQILEKFGDGGLVAGSTKYDNFLKYFDLFDQVLYPGDLTQSDLKTFIDYGYFIMINQTGAGTSHARLVWAISDDFVRVMDPMLGYREIATSAISQVKSLVLFY